jgi:hypothetical protein
MMGKIKRKGHPIRPSDMQIMAQGLADAVRPSFAGDHFAKIREREFNRYGNYGMAHDPEQLKSKLSMGSQATSFTPDIHSQIAKQLNGMISPSGPGYARPMGGMVPRQDQTPDAAIGNPMAATGVAQPAQPSTPYVNDSGWSVTLSGLLASKAFSQTQLQSASIQNMNALVKWIGGGGSTEFEHQQVLFMMQRYVLEGYLHGVDIPRLIQNDYHGSGMPIGFFADQGNTIGWGGGGQVTWSLSYWHSTDSAGQLADFYHELGHELMNEDHEVNGIMHYIVESPSAIKQNEATLLNDYFRTANISSIGKITAATPGGGVDPTPYLSGFPMSGPYNPSAPGPGPTGTDTNNTTNNTTIVAPTITPQGLGGGGDKGPEPSKPSDEKTLVAGSFGGAIGALGGGGGGGDGIGAALASLKSG